MKQTILKEFAECTSVMQQFAETHSAAIEEAARVIAHAFSEGNKLLLCGNGGSACDASHIAAEFVNRFRKERPALPALALNTDMAVITSISNDYDYSEIFARQVKSLGAEGDVIIAISTSGSSQNVIKAIDAARKKKLKVLVFTGLKGEKLASKGQIAFVVPSESTPRIQESHIALGHVLCLMVEDLLFERPRKK